MEDVVPGTGEEEEGGGRAQDLNGVALKMPGILSMSDNTARSMESIKSNGTADAGPKILSAKMDFKQEDSKEGTTDAPRDLPPPNGTYVNGISSSPIRKHNLEKSHAMDQTVDSFTPGIPRYTAGYVSLGTLMSRLAQETFNDMNVVIEEMAELSVQQPAPNGLSHHTNHQVNGAGSNNSEANVRKKLLLLNFTNIWRPKFIKTLVLLGWARRAEEVSKVIDLKLYFDTQEEEYANAVREMGQLSRLLASIKEPSPDIKTALQVLSLRKASWLPNLGYLEPEPLTPQQMLEGLRRINTALSIRLNLHENIPPVFRQFSIESGRVTFRVPDEFEVDLSILDEDPTSQFHFIDFRFAFTPGAPDLPPGRLQADLQGRAYDILGREGLQGLYDFLHNFVLTHKLSVLRTQAYEMLRGYWSEHMVVEPVRRALIVQYWSNRPGGKNWVEIGIRRGTEKRFAYLNTSQKIPEIALRHFRAGKEVKDFHVDLQLGHLSMEKIMKKVIARHTSDTFQSLCAKMRDSPLYSSGSMRIRNTSSFNEPTAASLTIQITATKVIKILREPITGRFAVQPASPLNRRLEFELNRLASPATDASPQVSHLRALATQSEVEEAAKIAGWELMRSLNPGRDTMRQHFPKGIQQPKFFRHPSWGKDWVLAFATTLEGDSWWVVELSAMGAATDAVASSIPVGPVLKAVYKLPLEGTNSLAFDASRSAMAQVERNAAGMICQHNDSRHLANEKIPHKVHTITTGVPTFSILLRYPTSKAPPLVQSPRRLSVPWANEIIRLDYKGLNAKGNAALRVASARLNERSAKLKDLMSTIPSLAVNPASNSCAFRLINKVGQTCVPDLTRRLTSTERLLKFALTIKNSKLHFTSASLSHLEFIYAQHPSVLKARIRFPLDTPTRLSLSPSNPHLRVLDFLTHRLVHQGLKALIATFRLTLPLLTALAKIEALQKTGDYEILARSEQWYEIRYAQPSPKSGFEIRLRTRREQPMWFVPEASIRKGETGAGDEERNARLKAVLRGRGDGWHGMHGGIAATVTGIADAIERLDEAFRSAPAPPAPVPPVSETAGAAAAAAAPTTSSSSNNPPAAVAPAGGGGGGGNVNGPKRPGQRPHASSSAVTKSPKRKAESQIVEID